MVKIIFVCHGNICRSPASEYVFNQLVKARGLEDKYECYSRALTTEEIGHDIYPPMKLALNKANIKYSSHKATLLDDLDAEDADFIIYMDGENKWILDHYYHIDNKKLLCLADFIQQEEISDPWYHKNFDDCLNEISTGISNLINYFESKNM